MNYLTLGIHYPKDNHFKDILDIARQVAKRARQLDGCIDVGAWVDEDTHRIVMMSLWESAEHASQASPELRPIIATGKWSEWERQPSDNMTHLKREM